MKTTPALAMALAHMARGVPGPFEYRGIRIHVLAVEVVGELLAVNLAASVPANGRYLFLRPPLQTGPGLGDVDAAFREMVGEAVVLSARNRRGVR